jgi:hypothetical protein
MWILNNVRLFVQKHKIGVVQNLARLQPLGMESVYHRFGYVSPAHTVSAYIVGNVDKDALQYICGIGGQYTFSGPEGVVGLYHLKNFTADRVSCISQDLRPDLDCDEPVYLCDFELWQGY